MHDYLKMIYEMLKRIKDETQLKKIYDYICLMYLRGGD